MEFLDFSTSNSQITDEIINVSDSNPVSLRKDLFYSKVAKPVVISTGAGGSGTVLTETSDYTIGGAFTDGNLPSSIAPDVAYSTVAITNAAYHSTDLYLSYYPIADLVGAGTLNIFPRIVERDIVNDISSSDVTTTPAVTNDTENGDRFFYAFQDGDGSHEFKLANPTDWTIAGPNGRTLDATALGRVGQGDGFVELEADTDNSVLNIVGYSDSDAGNFTHSWEKTIAGNLIQYGTAAGTTDTNDANRFGSTAGNIYYDNVSITFDLEFLAAPAVTLGTFSAYTAALINTVNTTTLTMFIYDTANSSAVSARWIAIDEWY